LKRRENGVADPRFIVKDVVVLDAQDLEALRGQIAVATLVACVFGMVTAVGFDDQAPLKAGEIDDVVIDDQLALELVPREAFRAQNLPQSMPGIGRNCTHLFGAAEE